MLQYLQEIIRSLDLIAIIVSIIYIHILGYAWYTVIFRKQWHELIHIPDTPVPFKTETLGMMLNAITFSLAVFSFSILHTILRDYVPQTELLLGISLAIFVWIGFIVPSGLFHVLFAKKPLQLWFIDSFFWLFALSGVAGIITLWM